MGEWMEKSLGDVFTLEYGKPLPKEERALDGAYCAYGANGVKCRTNKFYKEGRTVIVGRKGSAGEINLTEDRFWPLDVTYYLDFDTDEYDLMFLYYLLSYLNLPSMARGVKPGINRNDVYSLKALFPPLAEQKRIVAILDEAFSAIDTAIANTEKNLANARELFDSYLNNVFTQKGEGWVEKKLKEICLLRNGKAYKKAELLDSGPYPVLRVGNFFTNRNWYYSDLELDDTKYCDNGDLLYAWSASFGPRIWEGNKVIYHYHIWRVDFDDTFVRKMFLFYWFEWDTALIKNEQGAGTTMVHVSMKSMNARTIFLPSLTEQKRIISSLDKLTHLTTVIERSSSKKILALKELKQSILQKAFSGELTSDTKAKATDKALAKAGV